MRLIWISSLKVTRKDDNVYGTCRDEGFMCLAKAVVELEIVIRALQMRYIGKKRCTRCLTKLVSHTPISVDSMAGKVTELHRTSGA